MRVSHMLRSHIHMYVTLAKKSHTYMLHMLRGHMHMYVTLAKKSNFSTSQATLYFCPFQ